MDILIGIIIGGSIALVLYLLVLVAVLIANALDNP